MAVLNTTSPTEVPLAPIAKPLKTLPSSRTNMAGLDKQTSITQRKNLCRARSQKGEMVNRISPFHIYSALVFHRNTRCPQRISGV
jgi:hypothetical protein